MIMRIDSFYLAGLRWPQVCCSSLAATPRLTRTDIVLQAARTAARELLAQHHSTLGSICGDSSLDHWVQQRALSNQQSGATRSFVVCNGDGIVKAYVALASGAVAVASAPGRFRRHRPDPIPVVVLARLAVCRNVQGRGIVVHAASAEARSFYLHMGFDPSPIDPDTLLIRLSDVAATLPF